MQSTEAAILLRRVRTDWGELRGQASLFFQHLKEVRDGGQGKGRRGPNRQQQIGGRNSKREYREPYIGTAFAGMSESLDSDSPSEKDVGINFSSEHPSLAETETTNTSFSRENMDEKCTEYERAGIAIYIVIHKKGENVLARRRWIRVQRSRFMSNMKKAW